MLFICAEIKPLGYKVAILFSPMCSICFYVFLFCGVHCWHFLFLLCLFLKFFLFNSFPLKPVFSFALLWWKKRRWSGCWIIEPLISVEKEIWFRVVKEVHTTEMDWRWNATSLCNSLVSCNILGFLQCLFISNKYILSTLFPSLVFPFGFYVEGFNEAQSVGF